MNYRVLGRSGIKVSEIGYGTWGLGGTAYGNVDDIVSRRALNLAFDRGVTFYDTANLYGDGHSESLLGGVFTGRREDIVIATKGGTMPHTTFVMPQDFSPNYMQKALENSLRRMQTDYVDVYLLHSPPLDSVRGNEQLFEFMESMKQEGKIRAYGISARTPQDALCAIDEFGVEIIEVNFNIIDQRVLDIGLFKRTQELGVGVIVRTPLAFGYLTKKLSGEESFQGIDHRANWPKSQLKRWASAPNFFEFLYTATGRSPTQAALRFCLDFDAVATTIPGMMDEEQVLENLGACDCAPFSSGEMEKVFQIYQQHNAEFYDRSFQKENKE